MSSVRDEQYIFTSTDPTSLGTNLARIEAPSGSFSNLSIGGNPVPTRVVGEDTEATLNNKKFVDDTCDIVSAEDDTRRIAFDAGNVASGRRVQIAPQSTANRRFTLEDPGEDATFITSRGAQIIRRRQSISAPLRLESFESVAGGSALDLAVEIGGSVHTSSVIPSQREIRFGGAFDAYIRINTSGLAVKCGTAEFEISSDGSQSNVTVTEGTGLVMTGGVISLSLASASGPGAMTSLHYSLLASTTPAPTPGTIVARNGSGDFAAGTITANLAGNAATATQAASVTGSFAGEVTGTQSNLIIGSGVVTDSKIAANASISDTKLATISTAGKVANSATTATPTNTPSSIVARNSSGDFAAGTITASLAGNAATATQAANVTGSFGGDVTGTQSNLQIATGAIINTDININAAIEDAKLATISTAGKVANSATTASSTNAPNSIVSRNSSGDFAAGTITASLVGNATSATNLTGSFGGDITGTQNATVIAPGVVTNSKIAADAAISDTKLATISTAGKVANSATTASSGNGAGTIVLRNVNGDFSAGTITASLLGNAATATQAASVTGSFAGDVTGTQSNLTIGLGVITDNKIAANAGISDTKLATITTAGKVANSATTGSSGNTPNALVLRDVNGDFAAGSITASLMGNAATATQAASVTGSFAGDVTGTQSNLTIGLGVVTDSKIAANAAISDTKLGTISTAGKVSNSATTARSSNMPNALVLRDGEGDFAAGTITANLAGNATTANQAVSVTGSFAGEVTGTQSNLMIGLGVVTNSKIAANAAISDTKLATISTAGKVANSATTATPLNTGETIVMRNVNGDFAAGTITANLTGNATTATQAGSVTGSFAGEVSGTQNNMTISPGAITNVKVAANAAISDTKLATISSSGKVSNSATTATRLNTDATIVLRDTSGGTQLPDINVEGNIALQRAGTLGYRNMSMSGGTATGYLYSNFQALGESIALAYNAYHPPNGTASPALIIGQSGVATSRIGVEAGRVSFSTGSAGAAPVERLRVENGAVSCLNGASFAGNLSGNITSTGASRFRTIMLDNSSSLLRWNMAAADSLQFLPYDDSGNQVASILSLDRTGGATVRGNLSATSGLFRSGTVGTTAAVSLSRASGTEFEINLLGGAGAFSTGFTGSAGDTLLRSVSAAIILGTAAAGQLRIRAEGVDIGTLFTGSETVGNLTASNYAYFNGGAQFRSTTPATFLSGSDSRCEIGIGRTAAESEIAVVAIAGEYLSGNYSSQPGDVIFRSRVGKSVLIGNGTNSALRISDGNVQTLGNIACRTLTISPVLSTRGAILLLAGSGQSASLQIGRTSGLDFELGVAGAANSFINGTNAGDAVISVPVGSRIVTGDSNGAWSSLTPTGLQITGSVSSMINITRAGGTVHHLYNTTGGSTRWAELLTGTEDTGNVGLDWSLVRYSDAGILLSSAITVRRSDGQVTIPGNLVVAGTVTGDYAVADGSITNNKIAANAGISDTKLATISTAGKVANSATTATRLNANDTIVLRNSAGIVLPTTNVEGGANAFNFTVTNSTFVPRWRFELGGGEGASNVGSALKFISYDNTGAVFTNPISFMRNPKEIQFGDSMLINYDARYLSVATGNDRSYLYCAFAALGDGIHLGHNLYYSYDSVTPKYATSADTSRISAMAGFVSLGAGGSASPATEYLRVDKTGSIRAMNGATFRGPIAATSYVGTGGFSIKTPGTFRGAMSLVGTNTVDIVTFTMGRSSPEFEMGVVGVAGSILTGSLAGESAFYGISGFAFGMDSGVRLRVNNNGVISDSSISRQYELHVNPISGIGGAGNRRWLIGLDTTDSANNGGSNYYLYRYSNAGAYLGVGFSVQRSDGLMNVPGGVTTGNLAAAGITSSAACTLSSGGAIRTLSILSGSGAASFGLGISSVTAEFGVANLSNEWAGSGLSSLAGDLVIRNVAGKRFILSDSTAGYVRFSAAAGMEITGGIIARSGALGVSNSISLGRTAPECTIAVESTAGVQAYIPYQSGLGDTVIRSTGNLILAVGNNGMSRITNSGIDSVCYMCLHRAATTTLFSNRIYQITSTVSQGQYTGQASFNLFKINGTLRQVSGELTVSYADTTPEESVQQITQKFFVHINLPNTRSSTVISTFNPNAGNTGTSLTIATDGTIIYNVSPPYEVLRSYVLAEFKIFSSANILTQYPAPITVTSYVSAEMSSVPS